MSLFSSLFIKSSIFGVFADGAVVRFGSSSGVMEVI